MSMAWTSIFFQCYQTPNENCAGRDTQVYTDSLVHDYTSQGCMTSSAVRVGSYPMRKKELLTRMNINKSCLGSHMNAITTES